MNVRTMQNPISVIYMSSKRVKSGGVVASIGKAGLTVFTIHTAEKIA
jgi:hypothetical protein